jgi:acyl-CoA reductase-like NAD-dependent aldehyde dehydrogenase/nicotinamidase-related amidase
VRPALLLVDLQQDYLAGPGLQPAAPALVERAAALLEGFRARGLPVIHAWTAVTREDDRRMPHWRRAGKWACVEGSEGHQPPRALRPQPGETIVHKTFFSPFQDDRLEQALRELGATELVVAGIHLHACVRAAVLGAYQRGLSVCVADDAVGSDDPLHAAATRRYLAERAAWFAPVAALLRQLASPGGLSEGQPQEMLIHRSPRQQERVLWRRPAAGPHEVAAAVRAAREAWPAWRDLDPQSRAGVLWRLADLLEARAAALAAAMAEEVGKPVTQGQAEVRRSAELLRDAAGRAGDPTVCPSVADASYHYRPLGVVAVVSPWNNPLAIPVGKLGPALLHGNTVVWKPAPAATALADRLLELLASAGSAPGVVSLVAGASRTAQLLAAADGVDGVALSGSAAAGFALQEICVRRHVPYQAELGGNNAAIVWEDADLSDAAGRIAEAAFGFAGQRCTANRRAIIAAACFEDFVKHLEKATAALQWGDPLAPATQIGPVISAEKREQVAALVARARGAAERILVPHAGQDGARRLLDTGAYYPPTLVVGPAPAEEIVQEETFGPVLVVQRARDFDEALALCNGVRQGLVAALFSGTGHFQQQFLREARAGILKLNRATADANVQTPFGGWKASGVGPPEHGPADREFYTRTQAVYHRLD